MRHLSISLGLLTAALVFGTARADELNAPKSSAKSETKNPAGTGEALPIGEYVGRLFHINSAANTFVLQITTQRQVLKNPNGPMRTAEQIAGDIERDERKIGGLERDAVISRSPADYQRKQQEAAKAATRFQLGLQKQLDQLQQQQLNPQPIEYITLTEHKDFTLTAAKEVKVRLRELPTIDEEGRVHTFTAEEILALKGKEPNKPGYDGKLANLQAGDYVKVTIAAKAVPKTTEKRDTVKQEGTETRSEVVSIVVITRELAEKREPVRP